VTEFSQAQIVWYGITAFLTRIREYIAALKVLNEYCEDLQNNLLSTSKDAVEQQLLLDIAKIFDPAQYRKSENCSIHLLKELCLKDAKRFPNGEQDQLIVKIDELCLEYDKVISRNLRNKKIAHHDLESMFNDTFPQVSFNDLVVLIENYSAILSKIGERLLGGELNFPTIFSLETAYKDSLNALMSK